MKTAALCVAGWFVGYLVSAVSSILFFRLGGISPEKPASSAILILVTAVYGVIFAVIAGAVGASFSRKNAVGIGVSIALTMLLAGSSSWALQPTHSHWTQMIAILLMAPAAYAGGRLRRLTH